MMNKIINKQLFMSLGAETIDASTRSFSIAKFFEINIINLIKKSYL